MSTSRVSRVDKRHSRRGGFWALVAVGAVVALCLLIILVDSAVYHNKVHAGVRVSGIDLGGKTKDEALASLSSLVDEIRNRPLTITAGDKTWTVLPNDVGTEVDVEGAVQAALAVTRENNFFTDVGTRWTLYFTEREIPLAGVVDDAKLDALVAGIARELDVEPVNAALAIENGKIKVIESVDGRVVDQAKLAEQLKGLLVTLRSGSIEVPMTVKEPAVKAGDNAAAQQQAETMISGPVTVESGDESWTITPEEIASYMGFKAEMRNGVSTLVPVMDATKLQPLLDEIAPHVLAKPTNASFAHDDTHAWVVPGKNGKELDAEATAEAITAATLKPANRTVRVVLKNKEPISPRLRPKPWA